jgi:hypothetical protein
LKEAAMTERAETGRMQFGDDWPGVFIRGDDALAFARSLRQLLHKTEKRASELSQQQVAACSRSSELAALLESCRLKGPLPDARRNVPGRSEG